MYYVGQVSNGNRNGTYICFEKLSTLPADASIRNQ